MKIGIDGYEANTTKRVGIGQYAYQLLVQLEKQDTANSYVIFLPTSPLADLPLPRDNWRYVIGKPGSLWTIRELPRLISQNREDVFFSPTHYTPWFTSIPRLISVMDLSYLHYPEMFRFKDLVQLKYMGGLSIAKAKKIFTISEFSKHEIMKQYKRRDEDVVVTYPGFNIKQSLNSSKKFAVRKPYILFVGTIQPRKNIERLIKAYEQLGQEVDLLIVGKKGWLYESILTTAKKSSRVETIKFLDFVTDEELTVLYQNAVCLALPSLYEGFGIPVAEAMHAGCPVVISNTTSLPEVAGKAGIYVDPLNVNDIAAGLTKALQLSQADRLKLIKMGKEQIEKFNWETCAKKTIEVLTQSI